jgi:predicted lipoprotein with Yx(FWY)xxD motif
MLGNPPLDAAATPAVTARDTSPNRAILRTCSSLSRVTGVATSLRGLRIGRFAALAAALAVLAAGCGGSASRSGVAGARHVLSSAMVNTRTVKKYGVVLVNSRGLTLYMFVRDRQKKVTCTSKACVTVWPPLKIKSGRKPTAGGAARKSLLGVDRSPAGYRVVTYNRWPLYTYFLDKRPGQTTGQGVNQSGGKWYVLSPSGRVIKK